MRVGEEKLWYLQQLNLFSGMSQAEIEAVSREMRERDRHRGELIIDPESSGDLVYLVKTGALRTYVLGPQGREVTTSILRMGQLFGTSALIGAGEHQGFAEMLEDGVICEMSADEFLRIMTRRPERARQLIVVLARQFLRLEQHLTNLLDPDIAPRLAQLLLQLVESHGGQLQPQFTHGELARLIGTSRETVTRTLAQFVEQGLVELGYRRVIIRDAEGLRREARPRDQA
jgi:CRP/FNR family transcriptional regulator, cyclic AMP receptor protein